MAKSIAVITTSTRTPRVGSSVAAVVYSILKPSATAANIELVPVDVATFKLPVFDEAVVPAMINPASPDSPKYSNAPSIAWSAEIKRHDGYVLVIPEYNYGIAGGTKNAIDYLLHEWKGKPVAVISYGVGGGTFASEQTAHVLGRMGLKVADMKPQLAFKGNAGPDMMLATTKGELGPDSKAEWEETKGDEIRKAFDEVVALL
ncbi:flavoprotein-like protein [Echria macrotheca]|uniref:Flavoprotein-like protein n=1 Tax=Echria macrotheca TaxID=438768 RepID=A0AAJ0BAX3_9PEZI|nr:flavoprotein-like protein [Echria macrotheca]